MKTNINLPRNSSHLVDAAAVLSGLEFHPDDLWRTKRAHGEYLRYLVLEGQNQNEITKSCISMMLGGLLVAGCSAIFTSYFQKNPISILVPLAIAAILFGVFTFRVLILGIKTKEANAALDWVVLEPFGNMWRYMRLAYPDELRDSSSAPITATTLKERITRDVRKLASTIKKASGYNAEQPEDDPLVDIRPRYKNLINLAARLNLCGVEKFAFMMDGGSEEDYFNLVARELYKKNIEWAV